MIGILAVSGLVLSLFTPTAVAQSAAPPDSKITLDIKTINGSGCPAGTATARANVLSDNTAFTVTYSNFTAVAGAGAAPTDFRKNCQINVLVHVPQGFTYAVAEVDYAGFAHLESGATAVEQANYYFAGTAPTARIRHTLSGPFEDDWEMKDVADVATLVYAPCGEDRNLNINAELRVNTGSSDPGSTSFVEMDTTHASVLTVYHFAWKRC